MSLYLLGPHPSVEGRGTTGLELHGKERLGVVTWWWWWWSGRENELTSTTDAADVRFKLRSHAQ